MTTRRGFILASACGAFSSSALGSITIELERIASMPSASPSLTSIQESSLSYASVREIDGSWFRLANQDRAFDMQVIAVHDLNTDSQLEQFALVLKAIGADVDYTGLYTAYHQSHKGLRRLPVFIEKQRSSTQGNTYLATFSRLKTA